GPPVVRTVMDDQIDDLLFRQASIDAEVGERHVVPGVALVLEIVAQALPRVPELHGGLLAHRAAVHPSLQQVLGDASVQVDHQRRVFEPLCPLRAAFSCASRSGTLAASRISSKSDRLYRRSVVLWTVTSFG